MRLRPISLIGLSLLAAACSNAGGQTGDLSGQNGQEGGGTVDSPANCKEERRKLGSFDEETDLGTANGLLSFSERSFDAPVTWQPRTGQTWHIAPESGQGSIHIEVTRGENAYYVTSTPKVSENDRADGPGTGLAAALCPAPRLAVDAHVTVSSDGGALAESFDTTLYASYPGVASFSVPVDLDKLDGTLAVDYDDPQTELVQVGLGATLTEAGMTGSLSGILQRTTADAVSAMPGGGVIAVWPASAACASEPYGDLSGIGVTGDQNALGITGDAAAELLAQTTPASVTWRDGTSTELTLAVELTGEGCLRASTIYGLDGSARYPAHFTLTSADGRLNASYEGVLESTPNGDANGVHGEAFLELELDQMTQSGFEGVEVPSSAERLGVRFSVDVDGAGQTSGLVQLNGLADPPCVTDPAPVPEPGSGQGQGSPGCAGTTIIAVESATWGAD